MGAEKRLRNKERKAVESLVLGKLAWEERIEDLGRSGTTESGQE
jgi:hypothetical protein